MATRVLQGMGSILSVLALAAGAGLLIADAGAWSLSGHAVAAISAAPLLLVGVSFLLVQPVIRPRSAELVKNLLLAATFLLWGVIQLMPQNEISRRLGNVVVVLYVLDLAWVVLALPNSNSKT
jgi:hypothetical protein